VTPAHSVGRSATVATVIAATWTLLLVGLATLWIRSPFLGTGIAFTAWSAPAAVGSALSWWWLREQSIEQIPMTGWTLSVVVLLWLTALMIALSGIGAQLALDGLIMRRPALRLAGEALTWLPMVFGGVLSVAGLAAGLEARYRIVNAPPEMPATPTDPTR
jgi:hypothetical protein